MVHQKRTDSFTIGPVIPGGGRCGKAERLTQRKELTVERDVPALQRPGDWFIAVVCVLIIAVSALGIWLIWQCASMSLQAESNLHHSHFALQLVEQFVTHEGRWPRSWAELEGVKMRYGPPDPEWPAHFAEVQRRIIVDFEVDPLDVALQDRMSFTAIRPNGPYFEYRDYGVVDSLQAAIRKSVSGIQTKSSSSPSK